MSDYFIYNSEDDSYIDISEGLDIPWIELTEERYGDAYTYPAIYNITTHQVLQPVEGEDSWGTYSLVSVTPDNETETLETSFNFDFKDAFADNNIDIDASFSNADNASTWIYGNTARLTDRQYNDPDPSALRFSEREKIIEEGDSFAVLNDNGEIWYCTIEESASRLHGDRISGVTVSYFLAEKAESTNDLLDSDNDGFVDGITNYQLWTASGGVDLTNRRGRTYSDDSSRMWDAIKAVETDSGFSVLVEGQRNQEGKFKVATANNEGVVGGTSRWLNGNQMFNEGYEELFAMDFNGNSEIGF